jgi:hypothetical protein
LKKLKKMRLQQLQLHQPQPLLLTPRSNTFIIKKAAVRRGFFILIL